MGWPTGRLPQDHDRLHVSGVAEQRARESTWAQAAGDLPGELDRPVSPALWPASRDAAFPPRHRDPTAPIYSGHFAFERHSHEDH